MAEEVTKEDNKKDNNFLSYVSKLSNKQKTAFGIGIAGVSITVLALFYSANQVNYGVLYSNLDPKDGGDITAQLDQEQVPYQIKDNGAILVPKDKVNSLRLKFASEGLPKGGAVGFELLENQKYGTSQFVEQVNYQRGLEGELSRTIQSIASVSAARVHIAIPKQSLFVYNHDEKPTASVFLTLRNGRTLDQTQIAGIIHLVASSVPKLNYKDISIVDQNGVLLSTDVSSSRVGLSSNQLDYIGNIEKKLRANVETVLIPMLGKDNFKIQIAADVDFSIAEETEEIYKPNETPGSAAIRSKQSNENATVSGSVNNPGGVPGTLAAMPPEMPVVTPSSVNGKLTPPTTVPNTPLANTNGTVDSAGINGNINTGNGPVQATKNSVINYEVDKKIRHVKKSSGEIRTLSAAVILNNKTEKDKKGKDVVKEITDEEIKKVEKLVKNALGFNEKRGDTLSVVNASFTPEPEVPVVEVPVWKDPDNVGLAKEYGKYALLMLISFIFWRKLITPILKGIEDERKAKNDALLMEKKKRVAMANALGEDDEDAVVKIDEYAVVIEKAKGMVSEDSKAAANLVKEWMGTNEK